MKKRNTIILTIIATVIAVFLVLKYAGFPENPTAENHGEEKKSETHEQHGEQGHKGGSEEKILLSQEALETIDIKTIAVEKRNIGNVIRSTAAIQADQTRMSHVGPRITGRVIDVSAFLGDEVQEGQILAELDSIELGKAKSEYLQAKADLQIARANYDRERRLYEQKISSEKEYLDAKGEFLRSEARLKSSREILRLLGLSETQIENIAWGGGKHPLSHFPMIAPFSGTVIEKHIVLGELIEPEDKPYTIADLSRVWIQVDIYEKDLGNVETGTEVDLRVNAYPERNFRGRIMYISDILDESTRTARARVEIRNDERLLKPGMFATAVISVSTPEEDLTTVIPDSAIYKVQEKSVVFVKKGEREYEPREVRIGRDSGEYTEILEGLEQGEEIVTEGGFHLKSAFLKEELGGGHGH